MRVTERKQILKFEKGGESGGLKCGIQICLLGGSLMRSASGICHCRTEQEDAEVRLHNLLCSRTLKVRS